MFTYNDLYEILRKEKYSEVLQPLPKKFIPEFKSYLEQTKQLSSPGTDLFSTHKTKKQIENSVSMFKEITLKRKRKILNLVFVATETGLMKKDYENMLPFEKEVFDNLIKACEQGDRELDKILNKESEKQNQNKLILFKQNIEQFVDHNGKIIGPFKSQTLANLNTEVAQILVNEEKASFVDEN